MDYTETYDPDSDFDRVYTLATARRIARWMRPGDQVLELGAATGLMTAELVGAGARVDAVDRSEPYLQRLRARRLAGVNVRQAEVQGLEAPGPYRHVVATNLLHELDEPEAFLAECAERLDANGLVHVSLQNPRSLHRLIALELGMVDSLFDLSARGEQYGTRRLFAAEEVLAIARMAGLTAVQQEGVMVKPFDNARMAQLPSELLDGLERIAHHLPEHGAMNLFVFARA